MKTRSGHGQLAWLLLWSVVTLSGCASERAIDAAAPKHIVVLELPPTASSRSLGRVLHNKLADGDQAFLTAARDRINSELAADLRTALLSPDEAPGRLEIKSLDQGGMTIGRPPDSAAQSALQSTDPADAYLRIRVTDFGETPRRWEAAYVGFEMVSTVAIAGALYLHRVTRPLAAAYLAEETIEEVSEGYAGFWALNRLSRPVRVEADLVDGHSGRILWHATHTGLSPWRWRNLFHMDDAARDVLLDTSMRKAVEALTQSLRHARPDH